MNRDELQKRTREFALRTIRLVNALPNTIAGREMGRQLLRSATSVSANYRAARRARSRREFLSKISVVAEESDECEHWLDLIVAAALMPARRATPLQNEANELMKIFAAMRRTARKKTRSISGNSDGT